MTQLTNAAGGPFDASVRCPGCGTSMRALALERSPHGKAVVDLCGRCHALWFDAFESVQLTPGATLALFDAVRAAGEPARAEQASLACPRCRASLVETRDLRNTTRFAYWRCPRGHGRYTPFVQFLREKDFLRPLTPRELERLRQQVGSVRCSGCGAPVDLARDARCTYCAGPIEVLDAGAAAATLLTLEGDAAPRAQVDVDRLAGAIVRANAGRTRADAPLDLIGSGLDALASWLRGQ